jgi:hypothetical protein
VAAVEAVAGVSLDEGFQASLSERPDLVLKLFSSIRDRSLVVAHEAWRSLVNLAQNSTISRELGYKECCAVADYIVLCAGRKAVGPEAFQTDSLIFVDLACMLLSNMTKHPGCCELLLPYLEEFAAILQEKVVRSGAGATKYEFLLSVLADMTLIGECRRYLTEPHAGLPARFLCLIPLISDVSTLRRGGVCVVVKNCLMEADRHAVLLEDLDDSLLSALLGRLCDPDCEFSEEELDAMLIEVNLEHRTTPAESDPFIKQMVVESLIALGTTLKGRQLLRQKECYPVLRECHKREADENLRMLLEKVVEYIIRDEDALATIPPPTKTRKIELAEEAETAPIDSLI